MTTRIFPLRLCTWQSRGASSDRLSGGGIRALEFIQETSEPLKSRLFFFFFYKRRLQAYQFGAIWQFCTPSDRSQEETECQMSLKHYPERLSCGVGCVDLYLFFLEISANLKLSHYRDSMRAWPKMSEPVFVCLRWWPFCHFFFVVWKWHHGSFGTLRELRGTVMSSLDRQSGKNGHPQRWMKKICGFCCLAQIAQTQY